MRTLDRSQLLDALEAAGLDEQHLYEGYSGRAMYGDECFGIVGSDADYTMFVATVGSHFDDWGDWLHGVRSDSMGLSTIWYWPGVTVEKGEDDDVDE